MINKKTITNYTIKLIKLLLSIFVKAMLYGILFITFTMHFLVVIPIETWSDINSEIISFILNEHFVLRMHTDYVLLWVNLTIIAILIVPSDIIVKEIENTFKLKTVDKNKFINYLARVAISIHLFNIVCFIIYFFGDLTLVKSFIYFIIVLIITHIPFIKLKDEETNLIYYYVGLFCVELINFTFIILGLVI